LTAKAAQARKSEQDIVQDYKALCLHSGFCRFVKIFSSPKAETFQAVSVLISA
jgi:hypothetical protein